MLLTATGTVITTKAITARLGVSRGITTVTPIPASTATTRSNIIATMPMVITTMDDGTKGITATNSVGITPTTFISSRSAARVKVTHTLRGHCAGTINPRAPCDGEDHLLMPPTGRRAKLLSELRAQWALAGTR